MEEPENRMPIPSPQPSRELLEGSWGLDVTPERQLKPREKIRKSRKTIPGHKSSGDVHIDDTPPPASSLSMPQLNSTAQLCNKIHQLKHHNRNQQGSSVYFEPTPSEMNITSNRKLPTPAQLSAIKENVADLAGLLNHRPLKEVNIPKHTSRYSDLVPVEVSEESFQKLTTKPKKKGVSNKTGVRPIKTRYEPTQDTMDDTDEPSLMEFFSSDLEWEEAEWTVSTKNYYSQRDPAPHLEPLDVPRDAPLTLYAHMHHTWY